MRESLFHGVRAIRLIPTDNSKMYGRAGILAHSYMLGPNGQSNGCVSFSNYPEFLDAYQRGEVNRLVVVERLAEAPAPKTASDWLSNTLKDILRRILSDLDPGSPGDVDHIVAAIDGEREYGNLSSAIRLFVLSAYRDQISDDRRSIFSQRAVREDGHRE